MEKLLRWGHCILCINSGKIARWLPINVCVRDKHSLAQETLKNIQKIIAAATAMWEKIEFEFCHIIYLIKQINIIIKSSYNLVCFTIIQYASKITSCIIQRKDSKRDRSRNDPDNELYNMDLMEILQICSKLQWKICLIWIDKEEISAWTSWL